MNPSSISADRVAGALVGLAAGDALGAGYEFGPPTTAIPQMKRGGPFGWEPGEWTDDTQMALCIARVTAIGQVDPTRIAAGFLDWFHQDPPDVGNQTRLVLASAPSPLDVAGRALAHFEAHPRGSAGNGSLMRTAPVALACLGDDTGLARAARQVSELTHADPLAGDACVLWCIAIDRAVRQTRLDGIRDGLHLLPAARRQFWADTIHEAETAPPGTFGRNGYVVTALQAAYSAVIQTPVPQDVPCLHLQHALHRAVQIGDDTDTVAAIAGSLLGARWGLTAVPARWNIVLHGWPGLRAPDLVRLGVLTARGGGSDPAGWPAAPSLLDYYAHHYGPHPVDVCLPDDPGVRTGNVAALRALATDPPDVVVSLCRIGTADIPPGATGYQPMLMDHPAAEYNPNLGFVLADLAAQIASWRSEGRTVFIHCVMAESRTPTVAAAYLAHRFGLSGREALKRVRHVLPQSRPNPGFAEALDRGWPT